MNSQEILDEVLALNFSVPYIPKVDLTGETLQKRVRQLNVKLMQAKSRNNRNDMLYYAYRIGKKIKEGDLMPAERTCCCAKLTKHYRIGSTRAYYIFNIVGEAQIYHCTRLTLTDLVRLPSEDYYALLRSLENAQLGFSLMQEQES